MITYARELSPTIVCAGKGIAHHDMQCNQRVCLICAGLVWDGKEKGAFIFINHGIVTEVWCGCGGRKVPHFGINPNKKDEYMKNVTLTWYDPEGMQ